MISDTIRVSVLLENASDPAGVRRVVTKGSSTSATLGRRLSSWRPTGLVFGLNRVPEDLREVRDEVQALRGDVLALGAGRLP